MAPFYSSVSVSHDSVSSTHNTKYVKLKLNGIQPSLIFIIYTCAFSCCDTSKCLLWKIPIGLIRHTLFSCSFHEGVLSNIKLWWLTCMSTAGQPPLSNVCTLSTRGYYMPQISYMVIWSNTLTVKDASCQHNTIDNECLTSRFWCIAPSFLFIWKYSSIVLIIWAYIVL